jgi:methylphosphotriester-DNA--protein-cysteine methyltransferase
MICSLQKTHATKREAVAMLAEIVQKITETTWMAATVHRVHMEPHELYEVVKVARRWHIKATAQHLRAAKALKPGGYGV